MMRFTPFILGFVFLTLSTLPTMAQDIRFDANDDSHLEMTDDALIPKAVDAELEPMPFAVLQTLDKVTGRTGTATVAVDETVKLGTLFLTVRTCRKAPPIEEPESAAFLQVWQPIRDEHGKIPDHPESEWVFSGWMYASSPSVSAMDHPVYDVWVIDCKDVEL